MILFVYDHFFKKIKIKIKILLKINIKFKCYFYNKYNNTKKICFFFKARDMWAIFCFNFPYNKKK